MSVIKKPLGKTFMLEVRAFAWSFEKLNAWEMGLVHRMTQTSRHRMVMSFNLIINQLGNGWMYPLVALLVIQLYGLQTWPVLLVSLLSAVLAHLIYPVIKKRLKRQRPHEFDASLVIPVKPLDKYSCPSGHCMTLVAVAIPIGVMFPQLWLAILVWWAVIAWSRLSLGHHYLSDVFLGSLIGAMVAIPNAWLFL